MSQGQVRALYDFQGEPNTAELTIRSGEVLTVTRKDVGEGWWEGCNAQGQTGLFPAAYVEEMASVPAAAGPPAMPAPQLPPHESAGGGAGDDWGSDAGHNTQQVLDGDGWDDDWDDDVYSEISQHQSQQPPSSAQHQQQQQQQQQLYSNDGAAQLIASQRAGDDGGGSITAEGRGTVTKKNLNRFSTFVKSGGESYVLGTVKLQVPESERVHVRQLEDGWWAWEPLRRPYSVTVASPKKESKLKGLKSFIAYQLTPSFNNIQVSRRYKHFDWLHERLSDKFCVVAMPPLPDKQISGRYEEQFIEHRRAQLQEFVNWVCRHPVLAHSEVWLHFLTCTDDKLWKQGKRRAERDPLVGVCYCAAVEVAERTPLQSALVDQQVDTCAAFIHSLDLAVRQLAATAQDQIKKHQGPYRREFLRVGDSLVGFGAAFELDERVTPSRLTQAIKRTGVTYLAVAKLFEEQPRWDWEPLTDRLHVYRGLAAAFPDVLSVHRGAVHKRRECERLVADHKMDAAQLADVQRRTDVVSCALFAEVGHFRAERAHHLRHTMRSFLAEQVAFYQKIVDQLQSALAQFDDL